MPFCHLCRLSVGISSVFVHTLAFRPPAIVKLRCAAPIPVPLNPLRSYCIRFCSANYHIRRAQASASKSSGKLSSNSTSENGVPSQHNSHSTKSDQLDFQPAGSKSHELSALPLVLLRNLVQIHRMLMVDKNPMVAFSNPFADNDNYRDDSQKGDRVRPELQSLFQFILQLRPARTLLNVNRNRVQSVSHSDKDSDNDMKNKTEELVQNTAKTFKENLGRNLECDLKHQDLKTGQDVVSNDYDRIPHIPKSPLFDPVTAIVLAGYSFRAYLNPPPDAYHEVFTTLVDIPSSGEDESLEQRVITTHFHYPHAPVIASAAIGVFTLSIKSQELTDLDSNRIDEKCMAEDHDDQFHDKNDLPFLTATINNVIITSSHNLSCTASILRARDEAQHNRKNDDQLLVSLFVSRRAFERGAPPSHKATILLKNLVQMAILKKELQSIDISKVAFIPIEETERQAEFFQTSLLPRDIQLPPLPFALSLPESFTISSDILQKLHIALNVTFIPFPSEKSLMDGMDDISAEDHVDAFDSVDRKRDKVKTGINCSKMEFEYAAESLLKLSLDAEPLSEEAAAAVVSVTETDGAKSLAAVEETASNATATSPKIFGNMLPRLQLQLQLPNPADALGAYLRSATRLPLPSEWALLSQACRTILGSLSDLVMIERCSSVCEDAPTSLFVECHATDTQVSLFRDDENRALVIAFRGTDQMNWRDMFTDAQLFLQLWTPGEDISLEINLDRTVGLPSFLPEPLRGKATSPIAADASAVHYGFLQAYLSVREALRHAVSVLTHGDLHNYMLHFTGHSLGGALATIAAADFQAVYQHEDLQICCMTYGAPKVGNANFAHIFNKLVPNAFRIVNDTDIIARMPQSVSAEQLLSKYRHAGRTVLMNDAGELWVEGIHNDILEDGEWTWRDGKDALQELLTFEFKSWSEFFSSKAVKHHLVSCQQRFT